MNINEAYPSRFLSAEDLGGREVTVVIAKAEMETIGRGTNTDRKLVLSFQGKSKVLACNKTNAKTIGSMHGTDTDDWIGKAITLRPAEVEFQGDTVWAVRVSLKKPESAAASLPASGNRPAFAAPPGKSVETDESQVPF